MWDIYKWGLYFAIHNPPPFLRIIFSSILGGGRQKFVSGKGLGRSEESAVKVRGGAGL